VANVPKSNDNGRTQQRAYNSMRNLAATSLVEAEKILKKKPAAIEAACGCPQAGGRELLHGIPVDLAAVVFAAEGVEAVEIDLGREAVDRAVGKGELDDARMVAKEGKTIDGVEAEARQHAA
jgi:hypothetical protein